MQLRQTNVAQAASIKSGSIGVRRCCSMVEFLLGLLSSIILVFATSFAQAVFKRMFEKKEQKNHPVIIYVWPRTRDSYFKK